MTTQSDATVYLNDESGVYHLDKRCSHEPGNDANVRELSLERAAYYGRACNQCIFTSPVARRASHD